MITEDYVSFEIAKLLKEKGFDEPVLFAVNKEGFQQYPTNLEFEYLHNSELSDDEYACPTLQMAMKWLREVHNIIPVILTGGDTVTPFYYWFRIDKINDGKWEDSVYRNETECNTYEEACDAAIKYCLENLI